MDLTLIPPIGLTPPSPYGSRSSDTPSTQPHVHEVYAAVSTATPSGTDPVPGDVSLLSPAMQISSLWELVLIAVLLLSISGLVAFRLAELVSKRDLPVTTTTLSLPTGKSDVDADPSRQYERVVSPDTPPEFLSDEGKVVRLLVQNGGQIRQHRIVDETGWSKSKVSRILSRMSEAGTVRKVSIGRENVITLGEGTSDDESTADEPRTAPADHPSP